VSHVAVVDDVLLCLTIVAALLLAAFTGAAIREPSPPATAPVQAGPPPAPAGPAPAPKLPVRKPAATRAGAQPPPRVPSAGAPGRTGHTEYLPKHAVRGGPPWAPTPRPGINR
jgi:hypothetical protein